MDLSSLRVNTTTNSKVTTGEAFYFLQGSPQKLTRTDGVVDKSGTADDHLLQFELRFDSLRTYLEGFTTVVNQHASILNTLQADLQTRLIENNLYGVVQKLGTSSIIKDKAIGLILNQMHDTPKPENTGKKPDDTVNGFCNRLELFAHGFSHFHKTNLALNDRFTKIDTLIAQKVNTEDFRGKVKRTKVKLRAKMEDNHKNLEEKIKALEAKLTGRMDNLDRKVDEVEKHTTWRIKDCEDLLRSRINDTYVDDAIRLLEERLTKEIEKSTFGSLDNFQKNIKELSEKLKQCETHTDEKFNILKKNIKDVETITTKKLDISKFDEFKKEILVKIDANSNKIREVSTKCEPAIDALNGDMVKVNDEISKLKVQIKNFSVEIENLQLMGLNSKTTTTIVKDSGDNEANRAEMDGYMAKFKLDISKLKEAVKAIEEQLSGKVDTAYMSTCLARKLDISEFERMMMSMQSDNERLKRLLQSNEALQSELAKVEEMVDKKIAKLRKFLDIDNLVKQLKSKAEEENVSKGFENTDKKISALSENLLALKKELDQAYSALERLSIQSFSVSDGASLSTKKINPLACLSCGNMSKMHNPLHTTAGTDGKLYRADHSAMELYDSPTDVRSMLGKSVQIRDGRERAVNVTYSTYSMTSTAARSRPQTATTRKNGLNPKSNIASSPMAQTEHSTYRPSSAKK